MYLGSEVCRKKFKIQEQMTGETCPLCFCQKDAPNSPENTLPYKAQVLFSSELKIPPGLTRHTYAPRHRTPGETPERFPA